MKIIKMAVGNSKEAYVESSFSNGINIIFSNDNNKGKTIVIQSMMFALGNNPIFPDSFDYKNYYHYIKIEHNDNEYEIIRFGDSFIFKSVDGIRMFDSQSEFKHYWDNQICALPRIMFNGSKKIVDMELFLQMFFVGQDGKDTSTIFNSGFYHKDDYKKMIASFAGEFESELSDDEARKLNEQIKKLSTKRQDQINLNEFYKSSSTATEYLSRIKDKEAFQVRVAEMDSVNDKLSELRKLRSRAASRKSLWNGTLKELRSLNRNIEVGELRCMDCNSTHIAYKGTGKITYSFDVSTQEIRNQIISSIIERIETYDEEITKYDYEISTSQKELQSLLEDEDVTIENIVAYKQGFHSVEEIEAAVSELDVEISSLQEKLNSGIQSGEKAKEQRATFYNDVLTRMNDVRRIIDPDGTVQYQDLFTKRGTVASGSEETVFYVSRLIAIAEKTHHIFPIIMDSFRAEDLSTDKEKRVLDLLLGLSKQCILTTTLKNEETGKYESADGITGIAYSGHQSNKLLSEEFVPELQEIMNNLHIQL